VTETITVPGGSAGVMGAHGQRLAANVTNTFTVAQGSTLRLQQLLAELGYLPLNFTPGRARHLPHPRRQRPGGDFTWRWPTSGLADLVVDAGHQQRDHPGRGNELRGAAQPDHDGVAGPQVWAIC